MSKTTAFWRERFSARGYRLFDFVRPNLRSHHQSNHGIGTIVYSSHALMPSSA